MQRPWLQRHGVDTVVTMLEDAVSTVEHPLGWLPAPEVLPAPRAGDPVWRVPAAAGDGGPHVRHVTVDCRGADAARSWSLLQRAILPLMRELREALRAGRSVLLADASKGTAQACALVFAFFQLQCGMGSHGARAPARSVPPPCHPRRARHTLLPHQRRLPCCSPATCNTPFASWANPKARRGRPR